MGITPLAILVLGILNFTRDRARRTAIVVQALAALVIWTILTVTILAIFFMTVFEYPVYRSHEDEMKSTIIFVGGSLVYLFISGLLIFWTKIQTKRMPGMGISC
jgi:hypothetical protein